MMKFTCHFSTFKKGGSYVSIFQRFFSVLGILLCCSLTLRGQDYDQLTVIDDGFIFKKDNKWGYMDKQKNIIIPNIYEYASYFSEGLAAVSKDGKWGFINKDGTVIIPFQYDNAGSFREGMASVVRGQLLGYINKFGTVAVPFIYESDCPGCEGFSNGLAQVRKNRKYGYIDNTGKVIVKIKYDFCRRYTEGLLAVKLNGVWGYIDVYERTVIGFNYTQAFDFQEEIGIACVGTSNKYGLIDKTGKLIVPYIYDDFIRFNKGFGLAKKGEYYGIIDTKGKELTEFKYDYFKGYAKLEELLQPTSTAVKKEEEPPAKSVIKKETAPADIKSWAFVKNLVGSNYSDFKKACESYGLQYDRSATFSEGSSYYFSSPEKKFANPLYTGEVVVEEYSAVVRNNKIRGVLLEFLPLKDQGNQSLMEPWEKFERGFLNDGFIKTSEQSKTFEIVRHYRNAAKGTKIRITIIHAAGLFKSVEVILCEESVNMDAEE